MRGEIKRLPILIVKFHEVEAEELWSFVQKKTTHHWVWIAMDRQTPQILAFHGGDRRRVVGSK